MTYYNVASEKLGQAVTAFACYCKTVVTGCYSILTRPCKYAVDWLAIMAFEVRTYRHYQAAAKQAKEEKS